MFFICPTDNVRYVFEDAMETNFQCPNCGGKLESVQNQDIISVLKIKIAELERDLSE